MANGAQDFVGGLLGNPLLNLGVGLLAASGPSRTPVSIGQALAQGMQLAQGAQGAQLKNQFIRDRLSQRAQRREALGQLQEGLLGTGEVEAGTGNVTGGMTQQEMMGLLAQAAPEQFAQGLLGQVFPEQRRPNSLIEQAQFAFPDDPERQRQFVAETAQRAGADEDMLGQALNMMRLQQAQMDLQGAQDERRRETLERETAVRSGVSRIQELIRLNDQLRGTLQETGLGFGELRAAAAGPLAALTQMFGGDAQKARQVASTVQRFEQLTSREALDSLARNPALGQGTNQKLSAVFQTKPGLNQLPSVNDRILADSLQELLSTAKVNDITLDQREFLERKIKELRQSGEAAPETGGGVIDFNQLPRR